MGKTTVAVVLLWLGAIGLAGWTLSQLPIREILTHLQGVSAAEYLVWGALNVIIILVFNQRWWLISHAIKAPVNFLQLLFIKLAGQSISFITPGPQFGGEPLQVFWLWRCAQLPVHKALLTLGLDRVFEFIINFAVLLLCVALLLTTSASDSADWNIVFAILLATTIALTLFGGLIFRRPQWLVNRLDKLAHHWHDHPRLKSAFTHWTLLREDLRTCLTQKKKALIYAALLSVAGWVGIFAELKLVLWLTDIHLDLAGFLLFFVAMRLALLLPLPGGIGTMEAAIFWTFHYLNMPEASALVVIALMRLRDLFTLIAGLICAGVLQKSRGTSTGKALEPAN